MELITLNYIIWLILCLEVVCFILFAPPLVRRKYNKYDEFERINDISKKHSIIKPRYLMFNLDHQNEGSWYYKWISWSSEKIPRNTGDPILFLKKSIASIDNKEDKKIYIEWLINQFSEKKAKKNSSRKDYYVKLENTVHKIYDKVTERSQDETAMNFNTIKNNTKSSFQASKIEPEKKDDKINYNNSTFVSVDDVIENISLSIGNDGRGPYQYCQVKEYLTLYYYREKEFNSIEKRRDQSVRNLKDKGLPYNELSNAGSSTLGNSQGWQGKLDDILEKE